MKKRTVELLKNISLKMKLKEIVFQRRFNCWRIKPAIDKRKGNLHNLINNRMMKAFGYKNGCRKTITRLTFYKS